MKRRPRRLAIAAAASLWCLALLGSLPRLAQAQRPSWLGGAVIYCAFPEIFSPAGDLAGVTAQLDRLHSLGVNAIWLMPITPRGQVTGGHPAFDSPYSVRDYFAIDPGYGTPADLTKLVRAAHRLGIKVLLDEVLNHTSWDNPLIRQHPEYYVHSDGDPGNAGSISQAFTYADVAQLDYGNPNLRAYIIGMLTWWVAHYDIDGFRFDTVDNPYGAHRRIPAEFWLPVRAALERVKPDILMLGECEDPELVPTPFGLDYGWHLHDALFRAIRNGNTDDVQSTWQSRMSGFPAGTLHMALQDDWDYGRDVHQIGTTGALSAAVFNFTINGVPLLYNGMEAGNTAGRVNPHRNNSGRIDWAANPSFTDFYTQLIALRRAHPALQQGKLIWMANSAPGQVLTYERAGSGEEFVIEDNLSGGAASGSISGLTAGGAWEEVTPPGAPGGKSHIKPPAFSLRGHDFAIFRRRVFPPP